MKQRQDYYGLAAVFFDNSSYEDATEWNRRMTEAKTALLEANVDAIRPLEEVLRSHSASVYDTGRERVASILENVRRKLK